MLDLITKPNKQVELIASICRFIDRCENPPALEELSSQFNISSYHLQRTFKKIVGISPRQYAESQRTKKLKRSLKIDKTVTAAIYQSGYNSSSSLYQRLDASIGMKPLEYKRGAKGLEIRYTTADSALGTLLVAATTRGVCTILLEDTRKKAHQALAEEYPYALIIPESNPLLKRSVEMICSYLLGKQRQLNLPLDIQGTAFQQRVWAALQKIPFGQTASYAEVASAIGQPSAARAVARACATNNISLAIPCHRVVRSNGDVSGYRWGKNRKKELLRIEQKAQ
jgi:AraC family transcriptional regulator of adaptative response/methylated-DNA-[protein]-cysteine methyltransferase